MDPAETVEAMEAVSLLIGFRKFSPMTNLIFVGNGGGNGGSGGGSGGEGSGAGTLAAPFALIGAAGLAILAL